MSLELCSDLILALTPVITALIVLNLEDFYMCLHFDVFKLM